MRELESYQIDAGEPEIGRALHFTPVLPQTVRSNMMLKFKIQDPERDLQVPQNLLPRN